VVAGHFLLAHMLHSRRRAKHMKSASKVWPALLTLCSAIAIAIGAAMVNAHYLYGDWACAFRHCEPATRTGHP
jgi:uncharacterized membrane protein YhhN